LAVQLQSIDDAARGGLKVGSGVSGDKTEGNTIGLKIKGFLAKD
jgi:hypothetical protein